MSILSINIQGLLNNFDELKFVLKKYKPEICVLSETHVTEAINDCELKIRNYKILRTNSESTRTGGVVIYVNQNLKITDVQRYQTNYIWINTFTVLTIDDKITVAGIYMEASANKLQILDYFENWCNTICENGNIIFTGDFNIDVSKTNSNSNRLLRICNDNGLKQFVDKVTRRREQSATIIDLCFSDMRVKAKVIEDDQISDHYGIEIKVPCNMRQANRNNVKTISVLENYSRLILMNKIDTWIDQWIHMKYDNSNEQMQWFLFNLSKSINEFLVTKTVRDRGEFFDRELEGMRLEKNRIYKAAQYSENDADLWTAYREYRNIYKGVIKQKKFECMQKKLDSAGGDSKKTWKILNSVLKDSNNTIDYVMKNDETIEEPSVIANEFNKYFIKAVKDINNSIPMVTYVSDVAHTVEELFEFKSVSVQNVKAYLHQMKKKDSRDIQNISVNILLDVMEAIGLVLTEIVNRSFDTACFPECLRESTIVPIPKEPNTTSIDKFRPINTLLCIEKLMEKIACGQFQQFITNNAIICSEQSGFRNKHSCESAINCILADWREAQDRGEVIISVFLDFQKAFETVDRSILLKKLTAYGIGPKAVTWFKSYLENRSQRVRIGDVLSNSEINDIGVPQGSVLGPILFLLYINDMKNVLKHCRIKMFADDTLIYICTKEVEDGVVKLNEDLGELFCKLNQNKLNLNVNKTKLMIITKKNINRALIDIRINDKRLEIEKEVKYLGVILDEQLNFAKNCDYVARKMAKKVGVLKRCGQMFNKAQKIQIYKTTIEPHINYCSSILFLSNKTDVNRLQIIQNKCMRHILHENIMTPSNELLNSLNFLNVQQKIICNTLIIIYKIVNKLLPSYLCNRIVFKSDNSRKQTLRCKNQIERTASLRNYTQNSILYKGIDMYNTLPDTLTNEKCLNTFVNALNSYVKQKF